MPKMFDVIVTRDTTESCTMVIEGETAEEAQQAALDRSYSDSDLVWEQDDTPNASSDHYVTDVEETE